VTNNGPWVREFERSLTEYLGVLTLAFCNGQLALMTMLQAAGVRGGEVIVPSFTFSATPHAVRWCGAEPVFADIADDGSMCLDPSDVERRITPKTVAILGVDAYGITCNYPAFAELGRRYGIKVLYDSAPSFGSRFGHRVVGGFGDAQIFSFHATKAFATMEGGCLCSHDPMILQRAAAIRNFGQEAGGDCNEPGLNGKMTEVCALIGLEQLKTFGQAADTRRRAVRRMSGGISAIPGLRVGKAPAAQDPIWLYLPVIVDKEAYGIDRDLLATALEKEGLHVRKYYSPPCHHMAAYDKSNAVSLPVTERTAYNVVALPVYNDMTDWECDGIVQALHEIQRVAGQIARVSTGFARTPVAGVQP
jgi:dTDP-4-amino-4,6-dideoxyglucose